MRIGAIVQARYASNRFRGKILKSLPYGSGITALAQVIRRLKRSRRIDDIVIATTQEKEADKIVAIARNEKVKYSRGSTKNVLSRYYLAAKEHKIDSIVRITSDCPCIDTDIVDAIITMHLRRKSDYTSNTVKRTYPIGLDAEVFNFDMLEEAYRNARRNYEKEHVTPYFYMRKNRFNIAHFTAPKELYAPNIRITLDTEEDYVLLSAVFDYLYPGDKFFGACDIIDLFKRRPWLLFINKKIVQKKITYNLKEEKIEAIKILGLQGLDSARDFLSRRFKK